MIIQYQLWIKNLLQEQNIIAIKTIIQYYKTKCMKPLIKICFMHNNVLPHFFIVQILYEF